MEKIKAFLDRMTELSQLMPRDGQKSKLTYNLKGYVEQQMMKSPTERTELAASIRSMDPNYNTWAGTDDELLIDYYTKQYKAIDAIPE